MSKSRCISRSTLYGYVLRIFQSSDLPVPDVRSIIAYSDHLQIVVCQNTCRYKGIMTGVLVHEMIHMFDYCTRKLDFKNLKHLACTEIRAANLTHCSYMSAFLEGSIPTFSVGKQHAVSSSKSQSHKSVIELDFHRKMYY